MCTMAGSRFYKEGCKEVQPSPLRSFASVSWIIFYGSGMQNWVFGFFILQLHTWSGGFIVSYGTKGFVSDGEIADTGASVEVVALLLISNPRVGTLRFCVIDSQVLSDILDAILQIQGIQPPPQVFMWFSLALEWF